MYYILRFDGDCSVAACDTCFINAIIFLKIAVCCYCGTARIVEIYKLNFSIAS